MFPRTKLSAFEWLFEEESFSARNYQCCGKARSVIGKGIGRAAEPKMMMTGGKRDRHYKTSPEKKRNTQKNRQTYHV